MPRKQPQKPPQHDTVTVTLTRGQMEVLDRAARWVEAQHSTKHNEVRFLDYEERRKLMRACSRLLIHCPGA